MYSAEQQQRNCYLERQSGTAQLLDPKEAAGALLHEGVPAYSRYRGGSMVPKGIFSEVCTRVRSGFQKTEGVRFRVREASGTSGLEVV